MFSSIKIGIGDRVAFKIDSSALRIHAKLSISLNHDGGLRKAYDLRLESVGHKLIQWL